jgi:toxin YoeB
MVLIIDTLNYTKQTLVKLFNLLQEIINDPFSGTGKPEPLKHSLQGCWSRRINREHRLVYEVIDDVVTIHSVKGHYL